ncbi:MAG: tandem-95 repeat protein [Rivularia sp. (in: cyanobacteria)]
MKIILKYTINFALVLRNDLSATLLTSVKHGFLTLDSDGAFLYFPNNNFNGNDSFSYKLSDGELTDTATVNIAIEPVNDVPVAVADSFSTFQNTPITINVIENDSDVDGDALVVSNIGNASNGSTSQNSDGTVTYIPNTGFSGNDSFSYTVSDSNGETATATVFVVVSTISTPTSKLQLSLVDSASSLVNELAVFTADDSNGVIKGLTPGTEGYAQEALNRSRSVFSTIANIPNGFNTSNLSSLVEFDKTNNLRFILVNNSTLDKVKNGITPISELLFSDISLQQITDSVDGNFSLDWKDSSGNPTDFKDLVLKGEVSTDSLPLGTTIQNESGIELIDFRNTTIPGETVEAEFSIYREAVFNNYVGFYEINDVEGNITDPLTGNVLKPGDAGYIQTAVGNRVAGIDLEVENQSVKTLSGEFTSGSLFTPFIITNASPTEVLDTDTENDPAVYFPFLNANADGVDHIRLLANNVFGFEDLPNGGDLDYNDIVITANFKVP